MPTLRLAVGADLPPLGWSHHTGFEPARFQPVRRPVLTDDLDRWEPPSKPAGGLWTSPLCEGGTSWTRCARDMGRPPAAPVTVVPDPAARVYVIGSLEDLVRLAAAYPDPAPLLPSLPVQVDWVAVAEATDAVWLTGSGLTQTDIYLHGWDCETVFWTQPRFTIPVG